MKILAVTLFASLALASGILHGRYTGRWEPIAPLDEPVARLQNVPMAIGNWQGVDSQLDADELQKARIEGHISRVYKHKSSGEEFTLLVVCGRPGPISVHTPDICYQGSGYEAIGEPTKTSIPLDSASESTMWMLKFRKPKVVNRELEVHWGWTLHGNLEAPANSRMAYATSPYLFKVYIVREQPLLGTAKNPTSEVLKLIIPAIEIALRPAEQAKLI